ncbi:MAG: PIN domain-containing protein [Eubacterium sp.]|nr:PIN domain-containing protein [Eubacterium sp.]
MKKVYLDCCCYNRPFDDQSQERIHLETDAVLSILYNSEFGNLEIIGSDILKLEIEHIQDPIRKNRIKQLYTVAKTHIAYSESIKTYAKQIMEKSKIREFDSLHIASAAAANADYMLTTDDKLEKMADKLDLSVKVMNPLKFILEVF